MKNEWEGVAITNISVAVFVQKSTKNVHKNRPFHGFVLNTDCQRDYIFSDGYVLHTGHHSLFYLPKGSSYEVKSLISGGACYAINFDADISDTPFCIDLKDAEAVKKRFKCACDEWKMGKITKRAVSMVALYSAIEVILKHREQPYIPNTRYAVIEPALQAIERSFFESGISVTSLAEDCGISEVYLRKLFISRLGISPKEYIIRKRIDYACQLLSSGQLDVQTVSERCGYSDPCHFSREFKRRIGVPPKDYI